MPRILGALRLSERDFVQVLENFRHLRSDVHAELITADRTPLAWAYEQVSIHIVEWASRLSTNLLRTPEYSNKVLISSFLSHNEIYRQVFFQQTREDILTAEDGPEYTLFLGAAALLPEGVHLGTAVDPVRNLLRWAGNEG
ncbi:Scr1 family TA system antitoxin-like transcriptional regulator [Amycolatopsis sp. PS_44_ISF1]|uniref:Scr1 family TA system antitoxin-like transcriptional regulator n=1 Tax=Amycolatopsis sp. PS_44_ISF1 TaxID=2974917 RepID=UPI0028E045E4|nr:Scr1 family TA system antitoxin-like transcriptional regulator [Amycolatopsis sp. PS_44_ISF1]MDT8915008.1 Scr1 family TA system antitoxin-like transcriptional regulator [Amycolatopsis sp. PS_44_ISF1]